MKTTIEMPDELFRKATAVAALRGQTLKDLITTAMERELTASDAISAFVSYLFYPSADGHIQKPGLYVSLGYGPASV